MAGSSRGALGAVASRNMVRQNGSLTIVKKAPPSSRTMTPRIHNNNNINPAMGPRGSMASAWQDSRTNLLEKPDRRSPDQQQARQLSAYRRWLSRKVGQKDKGDERALNPRFQPKYRETLGAAVILYLGIGMIVVGLVFTFVGLGDRVFHTLELQLIGPSLIAMGFVVCGIRVLICACAGKCGYCDRPITPADHGGRQSSVDASDDSWRPSSWSPKERLSSAASAIVRRPPTPARIILERDDSSSSSSTFQDASDPGDLLSLRSEDSSDFSLSEFQEIEIRQAPPVELETKVEEQDTTLKEQDVGRVDQVVGHKGQDVGHKGQEMGHKEQDVGHKGQDVDRKQQDVDQKGQDLGREGQEMGRKWRDDWEIEEVHVSGPSKPGGVGRLEKKLSEGLILNVNSLQGALPTTSKMELKEDGTGSDHSWNMAMDTELN